jgi:Lar family restriction alleviation protein
MPELKLCPFCGGEAQLESEACGDSVASAYAVFRVFCYDCRAKIEGSDEESVLERWNTRVKITDENWVI